MLPVHDAEAEPIWTAVPLFWNSRLLCTVVSLIAGSKHSALKPYLGITPRLR
jgi:hypothetical protein